MSEFDTVAKEEKTVSRDQLHYIVESYSTPYASEDEAVVAARANSIRHYRGNPCMVYKSVKKVSANLPDHSAYVKTEIVDLG